MRPISPQALVDEVVERIAAETKGWVQVVVDGAPASRPAQLADELVAPLRVRGRPVLRVSADDFLRPASLRLEYGRTDPDVFYTDWLDTAALAREVLNRSGKVLPALWDSASDRAYRLPYHDLPPGGVLLLDGTLLLGRGLEVDLAVHLWLSPGALERRTAEEERWRLPAYARYEREVSPATVADVAVKVDDPRHPAVFT